MFVLDCSVAMAWCFEDECDAYADRVLESLTEEKAVVPPLWLLEVVNVLLVAERRRRLRRADSTRFLEVLGGLPVAIEDLPARSAFQEIASLARSTRLTAYDAAYLFLAMRRGLPLATRDRSLRSACRKSGVPLFRA